MPSVTDPATSAVKPALVTIDGLPHMVVGDSLEALRETTNLASYAVSMRGLDVARLVTPGYAILVQTVTERFAIDEALLDKIRGG